MKPPVISAPSTAAMANVKSDQEVPIPVPETITDITTKKTYIRGRFLGKVNSASAASLCSATYNAFMFQGGFARCYEVRDAQTNEVFACKVVSKSLLVKQHQREKMAQVSALIAQIKDYG
jgi:polo-like kinase 1